jgi:hypothetical protein
VPGVENCLQQAMAIPGALGASLLVPTDFDSRLVLHVWLDRSTGNLAVARRRMQSLTADLVIT